MRSFIGKFVYFNFIICEAYLLSHSLSQHVNRMGNLAFLLKQNQDKLQIIKNLCAEGERISDSMATQLVNMIFEEGLDEYLDAPGVLIITPTQTLTLSAAIGLFRNASRDFIELCNSTKELSERCSIKPVPVAAVKVAIPTATCQLWKNLSLNNEQRDNVNLINNRHLHPILQERYDRRWGLTLTKPK